ncbi:unnamed protein product [Clonostachys rosea f. rosea IK726]|uniref:NAD-dependent epimerase/dehydratase domain-containing protein n=2 Tax=Bionectria ochroleuca TaxID=29856 RepID=A0A0B7KCT7_BIOOC|nr:unnamed protein product [Clonostachys rosea f. rosea IK726]
MSSKPVAIITGGCSGMGEAFARDLVGQGWRVALFDLNNNEELIKDLGDLATFHKCNVASYNDHSLYVFDYRNSDTVPPEPDLSCTDVNVKGVYYSSQLAIYFMRKNKVPGGSIVITASASSLYPHQSYPEYSGSKAAVHNFVRAAGRVLKLKDNIRINCIRPGFVATPLAPAAMIAAARPENMTPIGTIVKALNRFLDDETLYGKALECSVEKIIITPEPEFLNGEASERASFLWEPGFQHLHHEPSNLPESTP